MAFDANRYLNVKAEINTVRVLRALRIAPQALSEEIMDSLDRIRKGFFKTLWNTTGLKMTPRIGMANKHIKFYRNPRRGGPLDIELGLFSMSPVTKIHETGGTVSAPSGMMAIPINDALTARGRLDKRFRGGNKLAAHYKKLQMGLFVYKSKGRTFLARKKRSGELDVLFILKSSIKISPRLNFYRTWNAMEGYRNDRLNTAVERAIRKVEAS